MAPPIRPASTSKIREPKTARTANTPAKSSACRPLLSGKLVGDLPVSKGRLALLFAGVFAVLAVLGSLIFEVEAGLIGGAILAAIVCAVVAGSMKTANVQTDANAYIPSSGVTVRHRLDVFTHRTVTRQPINRDSGGKGPGGK